MKIVNGGTLTIRGRDKTDDFYLTTTHIDIVTGGGATFTRQELDVEYIVAPESSVSTGFKIDAASQSGSNQRPISYQNMTPGLCSIADGIVTPLANGIARVHCTDGVTTRELSHGVTTAVAEESKAFGSFVTSSVARHISDDVATRIFQKTPSNTNQNRFSTNNGVDAFVRSSAHLVNNVDLTGIAATVTIPNYSGGVRATAISPQHIVSANHWHPPLNTDIKWVAPDNAQATRQIVSSFNIPNTDVWVGYLNAALPASIKPLKLLPKNYAKYFPSISRINTHSKLSVPVFYDFHGTIYLSNLTEIDGQFPQGKSEGFCTMYGNIVPAISSWSYWNGGSGSPVFTVVNNEAVLLYCLYLGGQSAAAYLGPGLHAYIDELNAAMAELHGGDEYQLQIIDLSGFSSY